MEGRELLISNTWDLVWNMLKFLLGTLFLLYNTGTCLGKFVVETNSFKVTYPAAINGSYQCAIANFGIPRYGGSITGNVVYPESNQLACSNFENETFIGKTKQSPLFLLADRGGNFVWSYI